MKPRIQCVRTQWIPGFMASGWVPAGVRLGSAFGLGAAAVGAGGQLEEEAVGVLEVATAAAVPGVDHAGLAPPGIGPVRQVLLADPAERGVELLLPDQERVVLGGYRAAGLGEVQGHAVVGLDHQEVAEPGGLGQAEDAGEERRRPLLVAARDDGVVQLHAHADGIPGGWSTQNSFPSGSARMCQDQPSSVTGSRVSSLAPRSSTRPTSASRSGVRRSRCSRFFWPLTSGTRCSSTSIPAPLSGWRPRYRSLPASPASASVVPAAGGPAV